MKKYVIRSVQSQHLMKDLWPSFFSASSLGRVFFVWLGLRGWFSRSFWGVIGLGIYFVLLPSLIEALVATKVLFVNNSSKIYVTCVGNRVTNFELTSDVRILLMRFSKTIVAGVNHHITQFWSIGSTTNTIAQQCTLLCSHIEHFTPTAKYVMYNPFQWASNGGETNFTIRINYYQRVAKVTRKRRR